MLILDTHALIWHASESDRLSKPAREAIQSADRILVSAISAWEIGMLVSKGRLSLSLDVAEWIRIAGLLPKMQWVAVEPELAVLSTRLPGDFHGDPADRLIASTAITTGSPLITADQKLRDYLHLRTIW